MKMRYKQLPIQIKSIDEERKVIRFVFSTSDEDRHGEIVDQKGWNFEQYLLNPVVLFAHDHSRPAVGKTLLIEYNEDGNTEADIQFASEENPEAGILWNLYKGMFMRAVSAGFINEEADMIDGVVVLKKNTLLEISLVNVPANAFALAKAKGIDVGTEDIQKEMLETVEKEGRVLSKKNRASVEKAVEALTEVLSADGEDKSADTSMQVDTPIKATPGTRAAISNRLLNKAIRALVDVKKN